MEEKIKNTLKELVDDYGFSIFEDTDRLSQFLEDRLPDMGEDIFHLTFAISYFVRLGWRPSRQGREDYLSKYRGKLTADLGYPPEDAKKTLETLDYIVSLDKRADDGAEPPDDVFYAAPGNLRKVYGGISNKPRMMWLRKRSFYNGLALLVALLAIAVLFYQIGEQRNPEGDEFRIAFFAQLEGPNAQSGHNRLRAAQLAVEQINKGGGRHGYKLKIIGFNTPAQPDKAAGYIYNVMKDKSLLVMMTCMDTPVLKAIAPISDKLEVPLVAVTPEIRSDSLNDGEKPCLYSFRVTNDTAARAKTMAYFIIQGVNKRNIGLLYDSGNAFTDEEHDDILRWLKIFNGDIKADIAYTAKNPTGVASAMKAIAESGANAMILLNTGASSARMTAVARAAGFTGTILGEEHIDQTHSTTGSPCKDTWWINEISSLDPQIRSVLKDYRSLYNEDCPPEDVKGAILAYDGVLWIANALYQAPGYRGEAIRHALLATKNFPMSHATLTIDPRTHGPLNKAMSLIYCDNNKSIFQKRIRAGKTE
ncbi:MAG: ABC transporter substrate-binding protein [Synergistaceae bacterium]|nr:ABC transporter substrate-binding protein [Synergistaceae bacterium]